MGRLFQAQRLSIALFECMTVTGFRLHTDFSALKHFLLVQHPPVGQDKPRGLAYSGGVLGRSFLCCRVVLLLELKNADSVWIFGCNFIYSLGWCQLPPRTPNSCGFRKGSFYAGISQGPNSSVFKNT